MFKIKNLLKLIGKNLGISLIAIIIAVILIFLISKQIEKITDRITLNHKLELELKTKTQQLLLVEKDAKIIGENYPLIIKAFIPSDNISEYIDALDKLSADTGIKQSYRFDSPKDSTRLDSFDFSSITYKNDLNGNVVSLLSYLKSFENLPYFTKIENLNIKSQDKNGWTGSSTITINGALLTQSN